MASAGIASNHFTDADGNPAGGTTYGRGFVICWQRGPLRVAQAQTNPAPGSVKPEDCPTPQYHKTHRYCPSCTWMEPRVEEPNGAFVEDVIKAAKDRLEHYQSSRFNCEWNAKAIDHLESALAYLEMRTRDREKRDVEGTHGV